MGVSGLLRDILKRYPSVHLPAPHLTVKISYLFIDFNAFIYDTIHAFPKDVVYDFTKNKEPLILSCLVRSSMTGFSSFSNMGFASRTVLL